MPPRKRRIDCARASITLVFAVALTGCFPAAEKYPRIDAPGATYFQAICYGGFGPPTTAYYPFHGVFISVNIDSLRLGVHTPPGTTAELNGNSIHVLGWTSAAPYDRVIRIQSSPHGSAGNGDPREFARMDWTLYLAMDDQSPDHLTSVPHNVLRGTIELPAMTINGQTFPPHSVHFERKTWVGILPVNC